MNKENPLELELMPDWAIGRTNGHYVLGAQLSTRDGRKIGNAHIVNIDDEATRTLDTVVYVILTDAGNYIRLTKSELDWLFYPPKYISDIQEVLRKFDRGASSTIK